MSTPRQPLDLRQWGDGTCQYAVGLQILHLSGHDLPCAPEEFVEHVDRVTGMDDRYFEPAKVDCYLGMAGFERCFVDPLVVDRVLGPDGYEYYKKLLEDVLGSKVAVAFTRGMFDELAERLRTPAAPSETRTSTLCEVPSNRLVRELLAEGYVVVADCQFRVEPEFGLVAHAVLIYGEQGGRFCVYDAGAPVPLKSVVGLADLAGNLSGTFSLAAYRKAR